VTPGRFEKPHELRSGSSGAMKDRNQGEAVLLHRIGSGPINAAIFAVIASVMVALCFTIIVVGFAVNVCGSSVVTFEQNAWYSTFLEPIPSSNDLAFASFVMRQGYLVRGDAPARSRDAGLIPWCAWCDKTVLYNLSVSWEESFNSSLLDFDLEDSDLGLFAIFPLFALVFGLSGPLNLDGSSAMCFWMFWAQFVSKLVTQNFIVTNLLEYELGSKGFVVTRPVLCLLNGKQGGSCDPCGDASKMNVRVIDRINETFGVLEDLSSGTIFNTSESFVLSNRCISLVGSSFFSPCNEDDAFVNAFFDDDGTPFDLEEDAVVDVISRRILQVEEDSSITGLPNPENPIGIIVKGAVEASGAEPIKSYWQNVARLAQLSLVEGGTHFRVIKNLCAEIEPVDLFLQTPSSFHLDDDAPREQKWRNFGLCHGLFALLFYRSPACLPQFANDLDALENGKVFLNFSEVEIDLIVASLITDIGQYEEGFPPNVTIPNGYPLLNFASNHPNGAGNFPNSSRAFLDSLGECFRIMDGSSRDLVAFLDFIEGLKDCSVPAAQLRNSQIIQAVLWFLSLGLFLVQIVWLIQRKISRYTFSLLCFTAGTWLIADGGFLFFGFFKWSVERYKTFIFFGLPPFDEEVAYLDYLSLTRAGALTFFYLHLAFTFIELRTDKKSEIVRLRFRAGFIACCYFLARGLIVWAAFDTHPGFVPYVNWISVSRICALDATSSIPDCNSPDVQEKFTFRPFVGNLFASLADVVMFVLVQRDIVRCRKFIRSIPYLVQREKHLVFYLTTLFTELVFLSQLVCGIVYTFAINPKIGYDGVYRITSGKAVLENLSISITGVQRWDVGFTMMFLFYAFAWSFLMMPLSSSLGKFIVGQLEEGAKRVEFTALREDAAANFDQRRFILQRQITAFQMTLSAYHIGSIFSDGSKVLPPAFLEIAYIKDEKFDTHVWIVASEVEKCVFIAFRGTTSSQNAKTDLRMGFRELKFFEGSEDFAEYEERASAAVKYFVSEVSHSQKKAKVHRGFLDAFNRVQTRVLAELLGFWVQNPPEMKRLVACGHSLGGALATVCAAFLATAIPDLKVEVSTFGAPRVGNYRFKQFFESHVPSCWRFVKRADPIPKTPFRIPCSWHHGYAHAGVEVLLEQSGDLILDPSLFEHIVLHRCRRGGGKDHKVAAYLTGLICFGLSQGNSEEILTTLWPNVCDRLRKHVLILQKSFPMAATKVIELLGSKLEEPFNLDLGIQEEERTEEAVMELDEITLT